MKDNTTYLEQDDSLLDSVEFIRIIYIIKKSIWWIVLFFAISFTIAFLNLRYTKPTFKASSKIKLEVVERSGAFGLANNGIEENNIFGEMEFIKSEVILDKVIHSLPSLNISYYKKGKFLDDERFDISPFEVVFSDMNSSIYNQKINVRLVGENNIEIWIDEDDTNILRTKFNKEIYFLNSSFKLLKTKYYNNKMLFQEYYFIPNSKDKLMSYLSQNLSVTPENISAKTIEISFSDHNKFKAKTIVNVVDSVYLKKTIEQNQIV